MNLEEKLFAVLSTDAGVIALVGTKVYPLEAAQDTVLPYVAYTRVSSNRVYSLGGYSNLENPRIQVDCYSSTYSGSKALSVAVISALRSATTFGVEIDDPQEMREDEDVYRVSVDLSIWNQEG
jgi:hypothetical protein